MDGAHGTAEGMGALTCDAEGRPGVAAGSNGVRAALLRPSMAPGGSFPVASQQPSADATRLQDVGLRGGAGVGAKRSHTDAGSDAERSGSDGPPQGHTTAHRQPLGSTLPEWDNACEGQVHAQKQTCATGRVDGVIAELHAPQRPERHPAAAAAGTRHTGLKRPHGLTAQDYSALDPTEDPALGWVATHFQYGVDSQAYDQAQPPQRICTASRTPFAGFGHFDIESEAGPPMRSLPSAETAAAAAAATFGAEGHIAAVESLPAQAAPHSLAHAADRSGGPPDAQRVAAAEGTRLAAAAVAAAVPEGSAAPPLALRFVDVDMRLLPRVVRLLLSAGELGGAVPVVLLQPGPPGAPLLPPPPPPGCVRTLTQMPDGSVQPGEVRRSDDEAAAAEGAAGMGELEDNGDAGGPSFAWIGSGAARVGRTGAGQPARAPAHGAGGAGAPYLRAGSLGGEVVDAGAQVPVGATQMADIDTRPVPVQLPSGLILAPLRRPPPTLMEPYSQPAITQGTRSAHAAAWAGEERRVRAYSRSQSASTDSAAGDAASAERLAGARKGTDTYGPIGAPAADAVVADTAAGGHGPEAVWTGLGTAAGTGAAAGLARAGRSPRGAYAADHSTGRVPQDSG